MARKKKSVKKASAARKTVTRISKNTAAIGAASERVVPIPSIAVFSELPFAPVGRIEDVREPSLSESTEAAHKTQGKQPGKTGNEDLKTPSKRIAQKRKKASA